MAREKEGTQRVSVHRAFAIGDGPLVAPGEDKELSAAHAEVVKNAPPRHDPLAEAKRVAKARVKSESDGADAIAERRKREEEAATKRAEALDAANKDLTPEQELADEMMANGDDASGSESSETDSGSESADEAGETDSGSTGTTRAARKRSRSGRSKKSS